jgi:hypothetical protein
MRLMGLIYPGKNESQYHPGKIGGATEPARRASIAIVMTQNPT